MRIEILSDATEDLLDGYHFYERQAPGLGNYFLGSLYSDIDSLLVPGDQPDLVIDAIRQVVEAVRDPSTWATPQATHRSTQRVRHAGTDTGRVPLTN